MLNNNDNFTLFFLFMFLVGVYMFVFSESGVLERIEYNKKRNAVILSIEKLRIEKQLLEKKSGTLLENLSDEELLRSGYVREGSQLVFVDVPEDEDPGLVSSVFPDEDFRVEISHLRVIWIVVSSLILFFYIIRRYRKNEEY